MSDRPNLPPTSSGEEDRKKYSIDMPTTITNSFNLDSSEPSSTYANQRNWSGAAFKRPAPEPQAQPTGSFLRHRSFRQSVRKAIQVFVAEGSDVGHWAQEDDHAPTPPQDDDDEEELQERASGKDEETPTVVGLKPEEFRQRYAKLPAIVRRPRRVLSTYRRLFMLCFAANVAMLVCVATGVWEGAINHLGLIVIANIAATVTIRCELLLNGLYMVATKLPRSTPLGLRLFVSRLLYHIGGIHSGCGTSALMWMIYFVIHTTKGYLNHTGQGAAATPTAVHTPGQALTNVITSYLVLQEGGAPVPSLTTLVTSYLLLVATVLQVASAIIPKFRHAHHNTFELMHRFCGWTALLLTWVLVFSVASDKVAPLPASNILYEHLLVREPALWLTVYITIIIVMPWTRVERVPVKTVVPSPHCIALTFPDGPAAGTFGRVSLSPLREWHTFATISPTKDADEHRMIMAAAGDWTKGVIKNPPTHMYVRRIRCPGFMYTVKMYNRVVLMATGAGIAPVLPHIMQNTTQMFILWVTKNPRAFFGDEVTDLVYNSAHRRVWDTAVEGRPDMVGLALQAMEEFGAEALHIVANEPVTKQVVYGLSCRGLTAFGAIWDS